MQLISGWAVSVSSTLRFERVLSMSSARTSTSSIFEPLMVSLKPSMRSRALSAPGRPTKTTNLPPFREPFEPFSPRLLAGVDFARADIGDAAALGRVAVGGEQGHLLANTVERVTHRLRVDRTDHDARGAGRDKVIHKAGLDRRRRLFGIFEVELVIRQFALRLLDAGLSRLPEVRRAVHDEHERLLVGGLRRSREGQHGADHCSR